jgi:hypothetical protein
VAPPEPPKKKGFLTRLFGGAEEEVEKPIEEWKISAPIKEDFKHVQ